MGLLADRLIVICTGQGLALAGLMGLWVVDDVQLRPKKHRLPSTSRSKCAQCGSSIDSIKPTFDADGNMICEVCGSYYDVQRR